MPILFRAFLILALSVIAPLTHAITANCEKDGEVIFTQECIAQMMEEKAKSEQENTSTDNQKATPNRNNPRVETSPAEAKLDESKPLESKPLESKSTEPKTNQAAPAPVFIDPFKQTTSSKMEERLDTQKKTSTATLIANDNCTARRFFKALENKNISELSLCPLTAERLNLQDKRAERRGRTPLHWAVITKNYPLIEELLSLDANQSIRSRADLGATPLHLAVQLEDLKSTQLLVNKSKSLNNRNLLKETPLHLAVKSQNSATITSLIAAGANIESRDRTGKTPLLTASLYPDTNTIQLLLDNGAKTSVTTRQGNSPLHYSVLISPNTTQLLIESGVSKDRKNLLGQTPLQKLLDNYLPQHKSTVALLEGSMSKPIKTLTEAIKQGDLSSFKQLLDSGMSPDKLTIGQLKGNPIFIKELQNRGSFDKK